MTKRVTISIYASMFLAVVSVGIALDYKAAFIVAAIICIFHALALAIFNSEC